VNPTETRAPSLQGDKRGANAASRSQRVAWVDYAKGLSIILVVSMHSALGVGLALEKTGWLHPAVAFAKPFRMPDFFLIAGLFVGRALNWPLRRYLDRKVVHFAYFFALWTLIILMAKSGELELTDPRAFVPAFLWSLVDPFSSLWFVQLLPFLFIAARLLRGTPPLASILLAAVLHILAALFPDGGQYAMASRMTGSIPIDAFCLFLVYFLIGHHGRAWILAFAAWVERRPSLSLLGLTVWGVAEWCAVARGLTEIPGLTLIFGLLGGLAMVAVASLIAKVRFAPWLAYCGRHSLPIYLSFALPMAATRIVLLWTGVVSDPGWLATIVTTAAIVAALAVEALVRHTPASFLFTRPSWARQPPLNKEPALAAGNRN